VRLSEQAEQIGRAFQRGWTTISINVLHIREAAGTVLVLSEFTAFGSGAKEGETLSGKSSSEMHGVM
jgi:hypothetical protein